MHHTEQLRLDVVELELELEHAQARLTHDTLHLGQVP